MNQLTGNQLALVRSAEISMLLRRPPKVEELPAEEPTVSQDEKAWMEAVARAARQVRPIKGKA